MVGNVSDADWVALGGGAKKQISYSSSIGSEAPTMDVSLCNKKHTTVASSCGGGGAERLDDEEDVDALLGSRILPRRGCRRVGAARHGRGADLTAVAHLAPRRANSPDNSVVGRWLVQMLVVLAM
jgi:hypothetical protein